MLGYPVFFILMDVVPDYVQKTFGMNENGEFRHQEELRVVREGENMPKEVDYAVIIFNDSQYHSKQAFELTNQIRSLNPQAKVMAIPVQG